MMYTKHLAHSINTTYYFGTALPKWGAVTGQVENWGHSSGRKKDKFSSLQPLSCIISYMSVFMGPKVQERYFSFFSKEKCLEPGWQKLESLAPGMWSKLLNLPTSSTMNTGILTYLLSKNLKRQWIREHLDCSG